MKVYSPSEVAELLKIKIPTLRKYSIMLEEQGYEIERNSQNHRYYQDKDIITLRRLMRASKNGITLSKAVKNIVSLEEGNISTNDTNNTDTLNNSDIKELKEMVHKQNELIQELSNNLDRQKQYINDRLKERDQALMKVLNESMETRKQLASSEERKGFFSRLFKKQ